MLEFFRRHQRYIFIVVTVVIIISFSFFGTYNTLSNNSFREQIAFTTIDGTDVTRHELEEMSLFLGTDSEDKQLFGGVWGPNFLNDGVIKKNFLETGLGSMLAMEYPNDIQSDLAARLEKEKRFALYVHPQAKFISTETAWNYFAPQMQTAYQALKKSQNPVSPEAFNARMALFLMEKQLPSPLLKQILRYQEKQYQWVTPDRNLDQADLSLFGYHTVEDWFGSRFVRLVSEFVINGATIAQQKGYEVSKADALADLMHNADLSYQQNIRNPNLGVANSREYFNEQLRRLGMDKTAAVKVWQQVLLFRRLFQDMGSSVFVDPNTLAQYDAFALASVEGELYRLPKELRLTNFKSMQKFETYLDAVAKRSDDEKSKVTLPTAFLTPAEVSKKTPELVQKRYLLEIAHVDKKSLEGNVGLKDSWEWEVSDQNWDQLKKQFPELGTKNAKTREERFAALDALDDKTRARVDAFARSAIIDANPALIDKALEVATVSKRVVGVHEKGGKSPIIGLDNGKALMLLLDAAPLGSSSKELSRYSADKSNFYRIVVLERADQPDVLTFAEAEQEGILDALLDKQLEAYYGKIRDANPTDFQKEDKSWKDFADVKDAVAELYYEKLLKSIKTSYAAGIAPKQAPEQMIADYAATLRFYPYLKEVQGKLKKSPNQAAEWTREPKELAVETMAPKTKLSDQWKLERIDYQTTRSSSEQLLDKTEVFALAEGTWSGVNAQANGDVNFFFLKKKGIGSSDKNATATVSKARQLLSFDAQQRLMSALLQQIKANNSISLEFMNQVADNE